MKGMMTNAQLWNEVFRLLKKLRTSAQTGTRNRRSTAFLKKHYHRVANLAMRPRGVDRKTLSKLPGFLDNLSTMQNLNNAAKAYDCRIASSGPHGKTRYRFVKNLRAVSRAA
jgi:hypothetical protein